MTSNLPSLEDVVLVPATEDHLRIIGELGNASFCPIIPSEVSFQLTEMKKSRYPFDARLHLSTIATYPDYSLFT